MKKTVVIAFVILGFAVPCLAAEAVTYEKDIKKIVAAKCASCHGAQAPTMEEFGKDKDGFKKKGLGPKMDSYATLLIMVKGSDAGALMRRLDDGANTKEGKPGNMFEHLGSTDAERKANLEVFKKWVGSWNLKRKKELTPAELDAIKAPEK